MTLEQFYKRLKEHGFIGYNYPSDDIVKISRRAAAGASIQFSKDATSWEEVDINWPLFISTFSVQQNTVLQLVSEYLQGNKKHSDNTRYCLVNPTPDYRYITDVDFVCATSGDQDAEMHFEIKFNQEPRYFTASELEMLKKSFPWMVPSIDTMTVPK